MYKSRQGQSPGSSVKIETLKGKISEIFFSFQAEGIYIGEPQIFVRLSECNIAPQCAYCDTDVKVVREMTSSEILKTIEKENWLSRTISVTGGEPLLQTDFLKRLLPILKKNGFCIYLETNGTLPDALRCLIKNIDIIAMDIKLPSSGNTMPFWEMHSEFLKIGMQKNLMVKVVLTSNTKKSDFEKAVFLVKSAGPVPFILQPVTSNGYAEGIGEKKLHNFFSLARQHLEDVRVIPQMHKIVGIR